MELGSHVTSELARGSLTIFVDGYEVSGSIVYALTRSNTDTCQHCPPGTLPDLDATRKSSMSGEAWQIVVWDIPIDPWPSSRSFRGLVHCLLQAMIGTGCRVAWIGAEGLPLCVPPRLFDPACMSGGVLTWMTNSFDFDFGGSLDLDKPLRPVGNHELRYLRAFATSLADAR